MAKIKNDGEESPKPKPKTRVVEATTTTKYKTPMIVPIEEIEENEPEEFESLDIEGLDLEEYEDVKPRNRRPTVKSQFDEIFEKAGIGDEALAVLRIERLPNFEKDGNCGVQAVRRFCGRIDVGPSFFDNDNHLDYLLKSYGPGAYWLTVRHKTKNLKMWLVQIDGSAQGASTRTGGEPFANQPPYVIQQPAPLPQKSFIDTLREQVEIATLMAKLGAATGQPVQNPAPSPQLSEDAQMATLLMKDPEFKARAIKNLIGAADGETNILELAITHGKDLFEGFGLMLSQVIATTRDAVIQIKRENGGHQNGQAQTGHESTQAGIGQIPAGAPPMVPSPQAAFQQTGTETAPTILDQHQETTSPEDYALSEMMNSCSRNIPVKVAVDRLYSLAEQIEAQSPAQSIFGYIDMFADLDSEMIKTYLGEKIIGGKEILALPHAEQWIADFQALVKQEGGENES